MGAPCVLDDASRHWIHPNVRTPCLPSNTVLMMWLCHVDLLTKTEWDGNKIPTIIADIYGVIPMCQELF